MKVTAYEMTIYETIHKSKILLVLYSCESLSKLYIIYQSTYFNEYFMQDNFRYPRIKKIHEMLEKITRFDQSSKSFVSCNHMNRCLQKLHYPSIYIFYLLFISRQVQKSKNDENPKTNKTIFIFCLNCFLFVFQLNLM